MEPCTKHEKIESRIGVIEGDLGRKTDSIVRVWEAVKENKEEIKEVKEFHKLFIRLESDLKSVDKKVDNQIEQSQRNTEAIIKALVDSTQQNNSTVITAVKEAVQEVAKLSKKTLEDRLMEVLVPSLFYGAIGAFVYFMILKG